MAHCGVLGLDPVLFAILGRLDSSRMVRMVCSFVSCLVLPVLSGPSFMSRLEILPRNIFVFGIWCKMAPCVKYLCLNRSLLAFQLSYPTRGISSILYKTIEADYAQLARSDEAIRSSINDL